VAWSCAPENVDRLVEAVRTELEAVKAGALGAEYVDKVKAAQRRAFEAALKTNEMWLRELADHYRHGTDPRAIPERGRLIEALTAERIRSAAARVFEARRSVLGVLRPGASRPEAFVPRPPGVRRTRAVTGAVGRAHASPAATTRGGGASDLITSGTSARM
jgi:predicted Zn-dependent peptidase